MNGLYCNHQHFITMGKHVGLDENLARGMFIEFKSLMPSVISQIKSHLPNHHPLHILINKNIMDLRPLHNPLIPNQPCDLNVFAY